MRTTIVRCNSDETPRSERLSIQIALQHKQTYINKVYLGELEWRESYGKKVAGRSSRSFICCIVTSLRVIRCPNFSSAYISLRDPLSQKFTMQDKITYKVSHSLSYFYIFLLRSLSINLTYQLILDKEDCGRIRKNKRYRRNMDNFNNKDLRKS